MVKLSIARLPVIFNYNIWIIDFGANKYMIDYFIDFLPYFSYIKVENVHITDRSYTPISEIDSINYTPIITLSSVLHVFNFPDSLLSISIITKDFNYKIEFFSDYCVLQNLQIGKNDWHR